ncbi:fructosamine kinase family protein [Actinotalea sp. M2MS4P-6]|uniref:fructosamine kinase family protein n=1 Tax=Actinotalea sp. M2MS4P-6 TaxID=2983762 RepID=UPI0021E3A49C|nr:fructosamine kinase family protein [Actinotalea sp. M2MS4P-6]MCV2394825.1 fructosamine kinase family protein [Actinotalea sp. M2MS4P-6]
MPTFTKRRPRPPDGFFRYEAAGLRWLRAAHGARVVEVLAVGEDAIELERLETTRPDPVTAEAFGRELAATHRAGAPSFGSPPDGWSGDGFFGPLDDPRPLPTGAWSSWGAFHAEARVADVRDKLAAQRQLSPGLRAGLDALADRLRAGEFDDDLPPARLHGDLWSGNVMWTPDGAVLIDPAAHGGHPLTDLAMLALFGLPHLDRVLAAYAESTPLPDGWVDLVPLHQVYPVAMHAVLFGGGYLHQTEDLVRRYV